MREMRHEWLNLFNLRQHKMKSHKRIVAMMKIDLKDEDYIYVYDVISKNISKN